MEELLPEAAGELCAPEEEEAAGAGLDAAGALPEPDALGAADEPPAAADEVGPDAGVEVSVTPFRPEYQYFVFESKGWEDNAPLVRKARARAPRQTQRRPRRTLG